MITCAVCGQKVPIEKSRLFYTSNTPGQPAVTYRTCMKGPNPHTKKDKR